MFIFSCLFIVFASGSLSVEDVVHEFHALKTKQEEERFVKKHRNSNDHSVLFYVVATRMKQVEYTYNPIRKLQIFNVNKSQLNRLIEANPNNIHGRYVRLVIQERMPRIVGYYHQIAEDKKVINNHLAKANDLTYLKKYITLNTSL